MSARDRSSVRTEPKEKRRISFVESVRRTWRHTLASDPAEIEKKRLACGFCRTTPELPPIVEVVCSYLEKKAIHTEGLFRVSGSMTDIRMIKRQFEKGKKVSLDKEQNVHTVAGVLKLFFTELPNSILTFELYPSFMAATAIQPLDIRLACIRKVIDRLPPGNREVVRRVVEMFRGITVYAAENKMSTKNIALVMNPTMFRTENESIREMVTAGSLRVRLIENMVDCHDPIFVNPKEEVEAPLKDPLMDPLIKKQTQDFFKILRHNSIVLAAALMREGETEMNVQFDELDPLDFSSAAPPFTSSSAPPFNPSSSSSSSSSSSVGHLPLFSPPSHTAPGPPSSHLSTSVLLPSGSPVIGRPMTLASSASSLPSSPLSLDDQPVSPTGAAGGPRGRKRVGGRFDFSEMQAALSSAASDLDPSFDPSSPYRLRSTTDTTDAHSKPTSEFQAHGPTSLAPPPPSSSSSTNGSSTSPSSSSSSSPIVSPRSSRSTSSDAKSPKSSSRSGSSRSGSSRTTPKTSRSGGSRRTKKKDSDGSVASEASPDLPDSQRLRRSVSSPTSFRQKINATLPPSSQDDSAGDCSSSSSSSSNSSATSPTTTAAEEEEATQTVAKEEVDEMVSSLIEGDIVTVNKRLNAVKPFLRRQVSRRISVILTDLAEQESKSLQGQDLSFLNFDEDEDEQELSQVLVSLNDEDDISDSNESNGNGNGNGNGSHFLTPQRQAPPPPTFSPAPSPPSSTTSPSTASALPSQFMVTPPLSPAPARPTANGHLSPKVSLATPRSPEDDNAKFDVSVSHSYVSDDGDSD